MVIHCIKCGSEMVRKNSDEMECPKCGHMCILDTVPSKNDIPEGCIACGGPYPSCMTSCKMFDD